MLKSRSAVRKPLWLGLIVVAVIALAIYLYQALEWEEHEINLGYSEAARRNPFLAAQQFLEQQGLEVEVLTTFSVFDQMTYGDDPLTRDHLVILVNAQGVLHGQRLDNLWRWLEDGGSLVASSHNPYMDAQLQRADSLLNRLPVSLHAEAIKQPDHEQTAEDEDAAVEQDTEDDTEEPTEPESCWRIHGSSWVEDHNAGVPFQVGHLGGLPFVPAKQLSAEWREAEAPHYMLRFAQGAGKATLVADSNIWHNDNIGCLDHAYALALLSQGTSKVWFIVNMDAPSLWRLLWRTASFAVIALLLSLALWLWAKGKRAAPAIPAQDIGRRSFLEHVRASAVFLWRHKQGDRLVTDLRQDLLRYLGRRYPGFANKNAQEQMHFINQRTALPLSELEAALIQPPPTRPSAFTLVVSRLQHIRNSL